jgi:hypothetical protein
MPPTRTLEQSFTGFGEAKVSLFLTRKLSNAKRSYEGLALQMPGSRKGDWL